MYLNPTGVGALEVEIEPPASKLVAYRAAVLQDFPLSIHYNTGHDLLDYLVKTGKHEDGPFAER